MEGLVYHLHVLPPSFDNLLSTILVHPQPFTYADHRHQPTMLTGSPAVRKLQADATAGGMTQAMNVIFSNLSSLNKKAYDTLRERKAVEHTAAMSMIDIIDAAPQLARKAALVKAVANGRASTPEKAGRSWLEDTLSGDTLTRESVFSHRMSFFVREFEWIAMNPPIAVKTFVHTSRTKLVHSQSCDLESGIRAVPVWYPSQN